MDKDQILLHYRKEEQPFIERVIEWVDKVMKTNQPVRTDFLDPRQAQIIQNIVNGYMELTVFFDGGYSEAERVRAMIAPDYYVFQPEEMGLVFFRVKGETKFDSIHHQDYMGSLLNIGIKREKFGDILLSERDRQFIVAEEVADYVQMEFKQIAHTKVNVEKIDRKEIIAPLVQYQIFAVYVSSLRADNVVSQVFHLSRSKVTEMIKKNQLKVNWKIVNEADYPLHNGDMVSFRGYGRFKFLDEEGSTKKGRFRIKIGKLI